MRQSYSIFTKSPFYGNLNPLELSGMLGRVDVFKLIASKVPDGKLTLDQKFDCIHTALKNTAIYPENMQFIKYMIEDDKFPINHIHSDPPLTLLSHAAGSGLEQMLNILLDLGADPLIGNPDCGLANAAEIAARHGELGMYKILLDRCPSVAKRYSSNDAKFELALKASHMLDAHPEYTFACTKFMQFIFESGLPIDHINTKYPATLLIFAAQNNAPKLAQYLLDNGANANVKVQSKDAIIDAIEFSALETFNILRSKQPEWNDFATSPEKQYKVLTIALMNANQANAEAKYLKFANTIITEYHYDINYCHKFQGIATHTLLELAASKNMMASLKLFLELGADINYVNEELNTNAFNSACTKGHHKIAQYLLQQPQFEGNKFIDKHGRTILYYAGSSGSSELVNSVCEKYADLINSTNSEGLCILDELVIMWGIAGHDGDTRKIKASISALLSHNAVLSDKGVDFLKRKGLTQEFEDLTHHVAQQQDDNVQIVEVPHKFADASPE